MKQVSLIYDHFLKTISQFCAQSRQIQLEQKLEHIDKQYLSVRY